MFGRLSTIVLVAAFLLALCGPVQGQGTAANTPSEPLTMEDAVSYGIAHNPLLQAAQENVQASEELVRQAEAGFLPRLDTSYSYTHLSQKPTATFMGTTLPTSPRDINHWEADVRQPLFTGFGLSSRYKSAKLGTEISRYRREETRLDLKNGIQTTFLQVLLAEKLLGVAQENVNALTTQKKNAEALFQQGLTPQNDVLKADVALAQAVQTERSDAKQLDIIRAQLHRLLNIDYRRKLVLVDSETLPPVPATLDELYARATVQRPEYKSLETSIRQTEQEMRNARSSFYPQISAFGQYYREGSNFTATENNYVNNQNAAIGVQVNLNVFEGGRTRAAVKELSYRQKALQEQYQDLANQIYIQVKDAYEQLQVASANVETAKTALTQALENERITTTQYREQLVIFLEVLNAQVFVAQARANYYQAIYGYQIALSNLERAVGGTL